MDKKQNTDKGLIVGIDITKYNVQISCLPLNNDEAETISTQMGMEQYEIPLCLFKNQDSQVWYYGDKAKEYMHAEEGMYVEDLWEGTLGNREIVLEDETYSYEKLMIIFLQKVQKLIVQSGYTDPIEALVFTMEEVNAEKIGYLRRIVQGMQMNQKKVFYVDYKESFQAYATAAKKELWNHDVFLFHYAGRSLKAFLLRVNQKTLPFQIGIGEMDFGELEYGREELEDSQSAREEMDSRFLATLEEVFARKVVSTVYLIGDGFLSGWMKNSLRMLCRGRRVFQGNNLFTKGACYAGREYLQLRKPIGEYLGSQMLRCDVRIPIMSGQSKGYLYAAKKGTAWYCAGIETECIAGLSEEDIASGNEQYRIEIEVTTVLSNGEKACNVQVVELEGLPKRPPGASRIRIKIDFLDEITGRIVVQDAGLGEFYPASGLKWEQLFSVDVKSMAAKEEAGI